MPVVCQAYGSLMFSHVVHTKGTGRWAGVGGWDGGRVALPGAILQKRRQVAVWEE